MTHPTDEDLDALDAKLASQIGDDVAVIFNHEYLFKRSRIAIAALRAQLARREEMHDCAMKERDDATLYADEQKARVKVLEEALQRLHHAVCDETGFARCIRAYTGLEYPWPALDEADALARAALAASQSAALTFTAADLEREGPDNFERLVRDGIEEAIKAMRKFPQPNYIISKIAEEAGEVVKAAIHCAEGRETPENLRGEMKQLIAMLYRLWIEGDRVHGLGSVSSDLAQRVKE